MKLEVNFEDYLDAEVVDEGGHFIGTLLCYWIDEKGHSAFLGIKSRWEANKTCVVPAAVADTDERQSCIWIMRPEDEVKAAPGLDCDRPLTADFEERVYGYFRLALPRKKHRLQINPAAEKRSLHSVIQPKPSKPEDFSSHADDEGLKH